MHKKQPNDDAVPTTKKDLLERWNKTKGREALSNYEYLTLFGNTTSDITRVLLDKNSVVGDNNDVKVKLDGVGFDASVAVWIISKKNENFYFSTTNAWYILTGEPLKNFESFGGKK